MITRTTEGRCREEEDASGVESAASKRWRGDDIEIGVELEEDFDERSVLLGAYFLNVRAQGCTCRYQAT